MKRKFHSFLFFKDGPRIDARGPGLLREIKCLKIYMIWRRGLVYLETLFGYRRQYPRYMHAITDDKPFSTGEVTSRRGDGADGARPRT